MNHLASTIDIQTLNHPDAALLRYLWYKRFLQVSQWKEGRRYRWILKSPEHLHGIDALSSVFPDASLIVNHRPPLPALKSLFVLYAAFTALFTLPPAENKQVIDFFCSQFRLLQQTRETKLPRLDVDFQTLLDHPLDQIESVARFAELPWNPLIEESAKMALEYVLKRRPPKLFYDMQSFGLGEADLPVILGRCTATGTQTKGNQTTPNTEGEDTGPLLFSEVFGLRPPILSSW